MDDKVQGLIDIGVNLTSKSFSNDMPEVLERAQLAGVSHMLVTGTNLQHSNDAIELCEKNTSILYSTAGVHPHYAKEWTDQTAIEIHNMAQQNCVKAIGECGLDYNRNLSEPKDQRRSFEAQLELAADLQLPVFLHQRDAHNDFLNILIRWRDKLSGGVAHCFTGSAEEAKAYIDLDLAIGITGWICDERRGDALQQAVKQIPLSNLLIETDAPYLLPRDLTKDNLKKLQSRRNEPCVLPHVCVALAKHKGLEVEEVSEQTSQHAKQLFNF